MEVSMTKQAIEDEIARATKLLNAREGKSGYMQNVASIKARIAELQAMTPSG